MAEFRWIWNAGCRFSVEYYLETKNCFTMKHIERYWEWCNLVENTGNKILKAWGMLCIAENYSTLMVNELTILSTFILQLIHSSRTLFGN